MDYNNDFNVLSIYNNNNKYNYYNIKDIINLNQNNNNQLYVFNIIFQSIINECESDLNCTENHYCIYNNNSHICKACKGLFNGTECYSHGKCTKILNDTDVECKCKDGWRDEDCNNCDIGYWGENCLECPGLILVPRNVCHGSGDCDGSGTKNGTGICTCLSNFDGGDCSFCNKGFFGEDCIKCPGSEEYSCYDNGVCDEGKNGKGTCVCYSNYNETTNCSTCIDGYYYNNEYKDCFECDGLVYNKTINKYYVCNNRGICSNSDGHCDCIDGYNPEDGCKTCIEGRYSDECLVCPGLINDTISCDGHGECNNNGEYIIIKILQMYM